MSRVVRFGRAVGGFERALSNDRTNVQSFFLHGVATRGAS